MLNLGIEGTMYAGAFAGFWAADRWSSAWAGLAAAVVAGALAGALMGLLTVTIGVNQHVAGIGTTLGLVAACDYTSRVLFGTGSQTRVPKFTRLFDDVDIVGQYLLTWIALLVAPLVWWVLRSTGAGLRLRAVGENPEAADIAGISVATTRYVALVGGGALDGGRRCVPHAGGPHVVVGHTVVDGERAHPAVPQLCHARSVRADRRHRRRGPGRANRRRCPANRRACCGW